MGLESKLNKKIGSKIPRFVDRNNCLIFEDEFTQPRNVRAVNFRGDLVLNRQGVLQGPHTHLEWLGYSTECFRLIAECKEWSPARHPDWRDLYFRATDQFYAGTFNHFSQVCIKPEIRFLERAGEQTIFRKNWTNKGSFNQDHDIETCLLVHPTRYIVA